MEEEQIRAAFSRVKSDIDSLRTDLNMITSEFKEIKEILLSLHEEINQIKLQNLAQFPLKTPASPYNTPNINNSTLRQINSTHPVIKTHNSTLPKEVGGSKYQNLRISTGNEGVSTDRQTDKQTLRQTDNPLISTPKNTDSYELNYSKTLEHSIKDATKILDSLDKIKKQIRSKFKKLTSQEMSVFSMIYQLEEQDPENITYKNLAKKLQLSESSIRDYVQRMITKGISIKKQKINNKQIILSISPELKRIASLSTILQLRDL